MQFPLDLRFKLLAFSSQIAVRDSMGGLLCYVKQKSFKLKEDVLVFADEARKRPLYRIQADRVIDISAQYTITSIDGPPLGKVRRRGMKSIWRAHYEIERDGQQVFTLQEENPWTKVADGLFSQIPIVGMFAGYVFHPTYRVARTGSGEAVMRVKKRPAFFEGRFEVEALLPQAEEEDRLALLSVLMMLLLERRRG